MQSVNKVPFVRILILIICMFIWPPSPVSAFDQILAKEVLAEINLARTRPQIYADFARQFRTHFRGNSYTLPGSTTRIQSNEGVKAVDEAILFLSRQKPLLPLTWSDGLGAAAGELAEEQSRSGDIGHTGRQSRSMRERIERHGEWVGQIGENIGYGPKDPRDMAMQMIIDDGVPDRGHRKNVFSTAYATAGIACGAHPRFRSMCVVDFAGGFRENIGGR